MRINKKIVVLIVFSFFIGINAFPQSRKQLERKIKKYEKDLRLTKQLLQQTKKEKKQTYNNLLLLNRQIELRQKIISSLKKEIEYIDSKISENVLIINSLQNDLNEIKKQYAKLVYFAWKNFSPYDKIMYVFASKTFNQAFLRVKYLQQISDYRKKQAEAINDIMSILEQKSLELEQKKEEKQNLIKKIKIEKDYLTKAKEEKKDVILNLQQKEKELLNKLRKQQAIAAELKRKIAKLIEEEARKAREKAKKEKMKKNKSGFYLTPEEKIISGNFVANKGKLPWPVKRGIITGKFGTHEHEVLKGIKVSNDGIYISTVKGATVRAIFDGEVRKVFEVPGKHKIVIIKHGSFYSVYGNLSKVFVKEGDKVVTKQSIGVAYTDENNKTEIELQIWQGVKKVNPESWIAH